MPMLLQFMLVWKAGVVNTTTTAPMESCAVPSAAAHPSRHQESILIFLFQNLLLKLSFFSINACGGELCEAAAAILMLLLSQSCI